MIGSPEMLADTLRQVQHDQAPNNAAPRTRSLSGGGYSPGHPWYYFLGGKVRGPKSILKGVLASGYQGYRTDIEDASNLVEPKRSEQLRKIRGDLVLQYRADLERYREVIWELRKTPTHDRGPDGTASPASVHTSASLKYSHLYNNLAHLIRIDDALSVQGDLFG